MLQILFLLQTGLRKKGVNPDYQVPIKSVKGVSCVGQLSSVKCVTNAPTVAPNLQIAPVLGKMGSPRRQPQSSNNPQRRIHPTLSVRPNLTTSPNIISWCVNPHRNLYLLEALHQLMTKNAVEPVTNQTSLGFYNQLFLVPKPNNRWRPILDLSNLNKYLKTQSFKMETPETIRTSLQTGEWVTSIDFKDAYFHIPIQSQSKKYTHFHKQDKAYHFKALSFGLSTAHGVHCSGQRGQVSCTAKGYKNPPVPRRLVGHS